MPTRTSVVYKKKMLKVFSLTIPMVRFLPHKMNTLHAALQSLSTARGNVTIAFE